MTIAVIAEKPSVARDIAKVLGATKRGDGYIWGGGYTLTWALGHLVALPQPHEIQAQWRRWSRAHLPMIPKAWPLQISSRTKSQFSVVRKILTSPRITEVICATDAGREGELIFRYIYEAAGSNKPVRRLWISSLTPDAIRAGFKQLRAGQDYDRLADAARGRSRADWLVGMNISRSVTLGQDDTFSVGRVQTPTLAMIVKRELEIREFVPEDYLEVHAKLDADPQGAFKGVWFKGERPNPESKRLPADGKEAKKIVARVKLSKIEIRSAERKTKRMPAPFFYDLTELQRHANRLFGFHAKRTLAIAQSLYEEKKLITYPRTDSRHLSTEVSRTLPKIVQAIRAPYEQHLADETGKTSLNKRYVNDAKVSDHHAIIPTAVSPKNLSADQERIYDLVCRRLLMAWQDVHIFSTTTVISDAHCPGAQAKDPEYKGDQFVSVGTVTEQLGWKALDLALPKKPKKEQDEDEEQALPAGLQKGQALTLLEIEAKKKRTKPPKRLTDATLLTAMETAGKTLDDKALSDAMRERGLGTPATRAETIETLLRRDYVVRAKKSLQATEKGIRLIQIVHPHLKSPAMTGEWEAQLKEIERGRVTLAQFMAKIERFVSEVIDHEPGGASPDPDGAAPAQPAESSASAAPAVRPQNQRKYAKNARALEAQISRLETQAAQMGSQRNLSSAQESRALSLEAERTEAYEPPPDSSYPSRSGSTRPVSGASKASGASNASGASKASGRSKTNHRPAEASGAARSARASAGSSGAAPVASMPSRPVRPSRTPTPPHQLQKLLQKSFGWKAFRPHQEEVCKAVTRGEDVLLVMPTGAGKSLCYQLPGIARGGTTLVISPLIALMEDQVAKLIEQGFAADRIHSGRDRADSRQVCRDFLEGQLDFLFVAPERLSVPGFTEMLAKRKPTLIAVDEAHCISHWGHDFRPDYRLLKERIPQLRPAPVVGLTATATPKVQRDIADQLAASEASRFIHGFRRTNIGIEVVEIPPSERRAVVASVVSSAERRPAIIYTPTRKEAEALTEELCQVVPADAYHAGLSTADRDRVQAAFLGGSLDVIVATCAFGMGIDKPDVRTVLHTGLPGSVEAYYQEIGRAGRDGKPSRAILLQSYGDRKTHEFFHNRDYPEPELLDKLYSTLLSYGGVMSRQALAARIRMEPEAFDRALEKLVIHGGASVYLGEEVRVGRGSWRRDYVAQRDHKQAQLTDMNRFAERHDCRMLQLMKHFGDQDDTSKPCGVCDLCEPSACLVKRFRQPDVRESVHLEQIMRSLIERDGQSTGQLFRGVYGPSSGERRAFEHLIGALVRAGLVRMVDDAFEKDGRLIEFRRVYLTEEGRGYTAEHLGAVALTELPDSGPKRRASGRRSKRKTNARPAHPAKASTAPVALIEGIKAWRLKESKKRKIPAYRIINDRALVAVAEARPGSEAELLQVRGVGPVMVERYGVALIELIAAG